MLLPPLLFRPAALAESVFDGVKAKMRNLRAALATKDNMLQALTQVIPVNLVTTNCRFGAANLI